MSNEKIELEIIARMNKKSVDEIEAELKNTKRKTQKDREMELAINLAKVRTQYDTLKQWIREAKRQGEEEIVLKLQVEAERMKLDLNEANRALRNLRNTGDETKSMLGQMLDNAGIPGFFSRFIGPAGIAGAVTGLFTLGQQAERTELAFQQMVGSIEKGSKLYNDLGNFAKTTPFGDGVLEAAKMMIAMGFEAEKILPTMKSVGEAVAAVGGGDVELQGIARALGQIQAKGKLSAEEVNQLAERGIGVWPILAEKMNKPVAELQKMAEQGKLLAKDVIPLLLASFDEKYGGMMDKVSKTGQGRLDELIATFKTSVAEFGKTIAPIFTFVLNLGIGILNFFNSFAGKITLFTGLFGTLGIAISAVIVKVGAMIGVFGASTVAIGGATTAVGLFGTAIKLALGPVGWIIGGLTILGGVIYSVIKSEEEHRKKLEQLEKNSQTLTRQIKSEEEAQKKLNEERVKGKISAEEYNQKVKESEERIKSLRKEIDNLNNAPVDFKKRQVQIADLGKKNDMQGLEDIKIKLQADIEIDKAKIEELKAKIADAKNLFKETHKKDFETLINLKRGLQQATEGGQQYLQIKQLIYNKEQELHLKRMEMIGGLETEMKKYQEKIALENESIRTIDAEIGTYQKKTAEVKNLENQIIALEGEQKKLREEYEAGKITLEEYNEKTAENSQKTAEARNTLAEYEKGLIIAHDSSKSYIERIAEMNALKLNPSLFNALIAELKRAEMKAYNTARAVALALQTKLKAQEATARTHPNVAIAPQKPLFGNNSVINSINGNNAKNAMEKFLHGEKAILRGQYTELDRAIADMDKEFALYQTKAKEIERVMKDIPSGGNGGGGSGRGGRRGGGGGGGKSKADQEEKKRLEEIKKKEEELAKIRTNAYKEANKRVEKFSEVIKNSNKKLEEQKKKLEEIKKSAEEVIKDLDEKLVDNQASFEEKIAKRYNDIIKDLKDELKDIGINGLSDEDIIQGVMDGQFSGGEFDKWKQELEIIQEKVDKEKLELALKNENLTETEKITAEYEKQDALLKNSLELQKAIKEGRFMTNADGGIDFLDENGNILKALDRDQEKEFASEVKKIQNIANEELKIFQEKNEKIGELMKEFEEEKRVLNEEYFEKDKEMRLEQHRMMEEFFAEEISKMEELAYLAGNFGKNFTTGNLFTKKDENMPENSTNTGNASVSSNKSVVESGQKSENIFKNEEKILDDRSQKNAEILQKFHDIVAKIEGNITSTTESEINRRMSLYAQEEARLNTLIAKRIQAGYAIASVPREFQNVNNTTNNSATINVNATSGGSIDANQLANTIMRKVQNYQKGIK